MLFGNFEIKSVDRLNFVDAQVLSVKEDDVTKIMKQLNDNPNVDYVQRNIIYSLPGNKTIC